MLKNDPPEHDLFAWKNQNITFLDCTWERRLIFYAAQQLISLREERV